MIADSADVNFSVWEAPASLERCIVVMLSIELKQSYCKNLESVPAVFAKLSWNFHLSLQCPCWKPTTYRWFVDTFSRYYLFWWLVSEKIHSVSISRKLFKSDWLWDDTQHWDSCWGSQQLSSPTNWEPEALGRRLDTNAWFFSGFLDWPGICHYLCTATNFDFQYLIVFSAEWEWVFGFNN